MNENNSKGWALFDSLISGATAAFSSRQDTEAERARQAAAQYAAQATTAQQSNTMRIAIIVGGALLAVVAAVFLFKR